MKFNPFVTGYITMIHNRPAQLLIVLTCISLTACSVNVIAHDPQVAAKVATQFADLVFVHSDDTAAEALLAPEMQKAATPGKLKSEVGKIHPKAQPADVKALDFEPLPGQQAVIIYLNGTQGEESFHYRILMVGDKATGYKVGGFWRSNGPYPASSNRKPL